MGLNHPADLDAWRRWQRGRNRLRTLKAALRKPAPADLVVLSCSPEPTVLVALDAVTPSALAAVLRPTAHLPAESFAVLAPRGVVAALCRDGRLPERDWGITAVDPNADIPTAVPRVRTVVSAGHFLHAGAVAYRWATRIGVPYCVVQHGLLTPFAPPLPHDATLFAFSDVDAQFWRSGRGDIAAESVGSQMLWDAATKEREPDAVVEPTPVFLGQLHGAELPRRISAAAASAFCLETGASYRPHPAETDRLSQWQHRRWQRQGIKIESTGTPLISGRPVAAIFSTGVLEAAAAGMPAWVTCTNPPAWVEEFWQRYGLARWGGAPTPRPERPSVEPSVRIAQRLQELGEL